MAFLLDTNIVSHMRRIDRTPPQFRRWAESIHYDQAYLSAITLMEVENGIAAQERNDKAFADILTSWRQQLLERFEGRILPVDAPVAMRASRLLRIRTIEMPDALIAATAYEHRLTMVTRNVRDFTRLGVEVLDPFAL
jgi:toxin FitB